MTKFESGYWALVCIAFFITGLIAGVKITVKRAVDEGAAHYTIDPKTGDKTLVFHKLEDWK